MIVNSGIILVVLTRQRSRKTSVAGDAKLHIVFVSKEISSLSPAGNLKFFEFNRARYLTNVEAVTNLIKDSD